MLLLRDVVLQRVVELPGDAAIPHLVPVYKK
jgi:hypothetical protein